MPTKPKSKTAAQLKAEAKKAEAEAKKAEAAKKKAAAEREKVDIRTYRVIYEAVEEIRSALEGMLSPEEKETVFGEVEVREVFKIPRIGIVAGCHVVEGVIPRSASVRLLRDNVVVYEGKISSLRRFKDDVAEVRTGFDCGIGLERFQDVKPGNYIEAFEKEEITPTL